MFEVVHKSKPANELANDCVWITFSRQLSYYKQKMHCQCESFFYRRTYLFTLARVIPQAVNYHGTEMAFSGRSPNTGLVIK